MAVNVYEPPEGTPVESELAPDGVSARQVVRAADYRSLAERMLARAPAPGYALWLDTASATHIYVAEAPSAAAGTAPTFRGVRVSKDASGNPLGKVQVLEGFVWNDRAAAAWA